jgi:hypothetical protein
MENGIVKIIIDEVLKLLKKKYVIIETKNIPRNAVVFKLLTD